MNVEKTDLIIKLKAGASDAHVSLTEEGGITQCKTVSVDDLIATLVSSQKMNTGVLPRNTRFFSGSPVKYTIGMETIARTRDFGVYSRSRDDEGRKQKVLRIPFPSCLFVFDVSAQKIICGKVFALKGFISKKDDVLYNFPFGNTYVGGKVCWGSAKLPIIRTPMNLVSAVSVFFDSSFNGDLVGGRTWRSPSGKTISNFWELVKYLDGKEVFPEDMLHAANVNLKNIIVE